MQNILNSLYQRSKSNAVGKIKEVYDRVVGKSKAQILYEAVRDVKTKFPDNVQRILNEIGDKKVSNIKICRTVVPQQLETLLQLLSLGKFNDAKIKNNFDKFYHLFMTFDVDNKKYMLEKNEVINLSSPPRKCEDSIDISGGGFTLNEMLDRAKNKIGDNNFFTYDVFQRNCQSFISAILKANNLSTEQSRNFIYQNIENLKKDLPNYLPKTTKAITDIAAIANVANQKGLLTSFF